MNACACPGEHQLRDYLSGRLDRGAHEVIDAHLDACTACQSTADGLDGAVDSSFPGLRPSGPVATTPEDPALLRLVVKVKALGAGLASTNGVSMPHASQALETEGDGTVLGNYVLLGPIGAGGMGRVFKARHRLMKRLVALKVLSPELLRSAGAKARFQREVEAAARLTHPNIVAAYDAGEADGRDFLVMEYVEGQNLSDLVKRDGPLPVARALAHVAQAARGLAFAHAAGVVHRDVKPANLLVDAGGTVRVLDMGLARLPLSGEDTAEAGLTSSGVVMGTAAFMAPEQAADTRRADERSDVYSLGCCLYFLLTGRPPYDGRTPMEILFAHREQPIPSLRGPRPDCPAAVDALFRAMIAKRPEDRRPSMTAVLAELEALQRAGAASAPTRRSFRRRAAPWLAAACVLLTATSLGAWAYLYPWSATPPAATPSPKEGEAAPLAVVLHTDPPLPAVALHTEAPPAWSVPSEPAPADWTPVAPPVRPMTSSVDTARIAAGEFGMGSPITDPDAQTDEMPRRQVKITQPFLLGKYKVTQALYEELMGTNPSAFAPKGRQKDKVQGVDTSLHPVDSVRWIDAVQFCNRLSERDGLPRYYHVEGTAVAIDGGDGWRLPTEAEWEYACRAGAKTRWCFGDDAAGLDEYAWYAGNSGEATHPVGRKKANAWGLYDMQGDVPEWCWDRYDAEFYKRGPLSDPVGGRGETRVYRGGGWNDAAGQTRAASRQSLGVTYGALTSVGIRVARNAAP